MRVAMVLVGLLLIVAAAGVAMIDWSIHWGGSALTLQLQEYGAVFAAALAFGGISAIVSVIRGRL